MPYIQTFIDGQNEFSNVFFSDKNLLLLNTENNTLENNIP